MEIKVFEGLQLFKKPRLQKNILAIDRKNMQIIMDKCS